MTIMYNSIYNSIQHKNKLKFCNINVEINVSNRAVRLVIYLIASKEHVIIHALSYFMLIR